MVLMKMLFLTSLFSVKVLRFMFIRMGTCSPQLIGKTISRIWIISSIYAIAE